MIREWPSGSMKGFGTYFLYTDWQVSSAVDAKQDTEPKQDEKDGGQMGVKQAVQSRREFGLKVENSWEHLN